jgi:hypothetical protein
MTVAELVEELQKLPQDIRVIMSKNDYLDMVSPLQDIDVLKYHGGQVTQEEADDKETVVVLFPVW